MRLLATIILCFMQGIIFGQSQISGQVKDTEGNPISSVNIYTLPDSLGTITDQNGYFELALSKSNQIQVVFSHVRFVSFSTNMADIKDVQDVQISLEVKTNVLEAVELSFDRDIVGVNAIKIEPETIIMSPVPFNDISKMLSTLPSVISNNELSTAYSVRGGNYDENLVLVNGIPIYRPFLVRAGRQEGLSFINPYLIDNVEFSAGGWSPTYGDKMSSVLATTYRQPDKFHGSAMVSLLGASAHVEGSIDEGSVTYLVGARYKRSAYLLNTLDVDGTYNPSFTDVQSFWDFKLNENANLELLLAFAANRYGVVPETSETTFGTFQEELRLNVAFDGQEQMNYNSFQTALKFNQVLSDKWMVSLMASMANSKEREYIDLEGGYRLCDVDKQVGSDTFDQCIRTRGIGTLYNYSRNQLDARMIDIRAQSNLEINSSNSLVAGLQYSNQDINDVLDEYNFTDSAGYVNTSPVAYAENETNANIIAGFMTHNLDKENFNMSYGFRLNYNTLNEYLIFSPRLELAVDAGEATTWHLGTGLYQQQPFYREYRDLLGVVNTDVKAQSSFHAITGVDYTFDWWHRPFTLSIDAYYKYLWNQIPYTYENLRIRYYPDQSAIAYAVGFEARLGGEFIPGTESWFSLGVMSTEEQVAGFDDTWVRRPTDQRFNLAIMFEDHLPNDPSFRVNLSFVYGSGLPFGPPTDLERRNSFTGDDYLRLDIGFSKVFTFKEKFFESLRIGAYVNNLLDVKNAVTYTWIEDFNSNQFAVPNNLTGRLFNASVSVAF
jgi:hypothetical protein